MSIKEIDLARLEPLLDATSEEILDRFVSNLEPPEFLGMNGDEAPGSAIDRRRRILREISVRRGQKKFRDKLNRHYGGACQISGFDFVELVEAAHIDPYSESGDDSLHNGLLLRSDLHTLFDLGYLGIEPDTLRIRLHPSVRKGEYLRLDGADLISNGTDGPAKTSLKKRWSLFCEKLNS
jgi:hypothetical protein